jgi:uncharacterized protein (UPF0332 family)|tara:strand:+ start:233 stop:520 length:288 start_codon:yes stop_codon:yes gene_type:complete
MNSLEDVHYRLKLAKGFLDEAQGDYRLERWRSCVSNFQLLVENSNKALLILFGISPKTHQPDIHLSKWAEKGDTPDVLKQMLKDALPHFRALGFE